MKQSESATQPMPIATLMYHDVVPASEPDGSGFPGPGPGTYKLDWPSFTAHLDALAAVGAKPVAHDAAGAARGTLLLTFDDGGSCSRAVAEALSERGWIGHFFVPAALIGTAGFSSADDLRAIHDLGHVVGSHSHTHPPRLSALSDDEIASEWARSTAAIAEITGSSVTAASVPGGFTSRSVEEAAAGAGIATLFTSQPTTQVRTVGGATVLGRYAIRAQTPAAEAVALATGRGTVRRRHAAAWAARSVSKRLLGGAYPRVRRMLVHVRER